MQAGVFCGTELTIWGRPRIKKRFSQSKNAGKTVSQEINTRVHVIADLLYVRIFVHLCCYLGKFVCSLLKKSRKSIKCACQPCKNIHGARTETIAAVFDILKLLCCT